MKSSKSTNQGSLLESQLLNIYLNITSYTYSQWLNDTGGCRSPTFLPKLWCPSHSRASCDIGLRLQVKPHLCFALSPAPFLFLQSPLCAGFCWDYCLSKSLHQKSPSQDLLLGNWPKTFSCWNSCCIRHILKRSKTRVEVLYLRHTILQVDK